MKTNTIIITLLICVGTFTSSFSQETDYAKVEKTVNYYLVGGTIGDYNLLARAFHKDATMKYISDGEYKEVKALDFFEKAIVQGEKSNRITKVISINISGNAASATLQINYPTSSITDYMNLLKIDGDWKIVNKVFHRN
mgnify:CR=1 FL=1